MIETETMYAEFKKAAIERGLSQAEVMLIVGRIFELAYRLNIKPDALRGVFKAYKAMVG